MIVDFHRFGGSPRLTSVNNSITGTLHHAAFLAPIYLAIIPRPTIKITFRSVNDIGPHWIFMDIVQFLKCKLWAIEFNRMVFLPPELMLLFPWILMTCAAEYGETSSCSCFHPH